MSGSVNAAPCQHGGTPCQHGGDLLRAKMYGRRAAVFHCLETQ